MSRIASDPRIDPRLRAFFGGWENPAIAGGFSSRAEMLAAEATPDAQIRARAMTDFMESFDTEANAPSAGLHVTVAEYASAPDNNQVKVRITRPADSKVRACVYYLHGGAMQALSCFDGLYRAWARLIASYGVAVVMPDFRNALRPSSSLEVAPYPAGLNDCIAGLDWLHANADDLAIDPARVTIAGDSGGGNLAVATAISISKKRPPNFAGVYAMCPYIAGHWPSDAHPSSREFDGYILHSSALNEGVLAYGAEAYQAGDAEAWPGLATARDVRNLPRTIISVNECDPLRDEGVALYRLLLASGVKARCRQVMGTTHAAEVYLGVCPDISHDTARDLASFAKDDR
jgi:acetyl esterase